MISMLERCARAAERELGISEALMAAPQVLDALKAKRIVRAVLNTLRDEPSEGMLEAGREHGWGIPADCYMADVPTIFAAMLTVALEE